MPSSVLPDILSSGRTPLQHIIQGARCSQSFGKPTCHGPSLFSNLACAGTLCSTFFLRTCTLDLLPVRSKPGSAALPAGLVRPSPTNASSPTAAALFKLACNHIYHSQGCEQKIGGWGCRHRPDMHNRGSRPGRRLRKKGCLVLSGESTMRSDCWHCRWQGSCRFGSKTLPRIIRAEQNRAGRTAGLSRDGKVLEASISGSQACVGTF